MKTSLFTLLLSSISLFVFAQNDSISIGQKEYLQIIDSINNGFTYQYGNIQLDNEIATLLVPDGYKFLDAEQSQYVLTDLWGNPPQSVLGMLLPENNNPLDKDMAFAVEVTYSADGYIEDEDAKDIDYDDLLEEMQEDTQNTNPERKENGYPEIQLIGWASAPFYDAENKKLHWAKELKFENYEVNTLNYNIRILGRKGCLNLNAIGNISVLPKFQQDADKIIAAVEFNPGNRYGEFDPKMDKVAAYGISGLIAGKALAKTGFSALILKFWKVLVIAGAGALAAFKKNLFLGKEG